MSAGTCLSWIGSSDGSCHKSLVWDPMFVSGQPLPKAVISLQHHDAHVEKTDRSLHAELRILGLDLQKNEALLSEQQ